MKSHALTLNKYEEKKRKSGEELTGLKESGKLWEMNMTYISTKREGMLYLFNVKDCFTKEWIVYLLSRTCNRRDAVKALEQVYLSAFNGEKVKVLVLRTNNGTQFTARIFKETVKLLRITLEFIEKHMPEDNGDIESFHRTIKIGLYLGHMSLKITTKQIMR
ncbi:MAG: DDE-type integrase/transposase/recombinase [Thermoplasmata archaeon]